MKKLQMTFAMLVLCTWYGCSQTKKDQSKLVGGGCDGCEAIFDFGTKKLNWIDTLPDFREAGPKMEVSGTIYQKDGKSPANGVILYVYHTDQKGYYSNKGDNSRKIRHGYIRGWIKTGPDGHYKFYTLRPAAYPGRTAPEHIHPIVKEPGINEYYIDEYLFDDDPLLTAEHRKKAEDRGGSGIIALLKDKNGLLLCRRDIILGKNIPNY